MEVDDTANTGKSATVVCVQYLISQYLKNKRMIRKDDLFKIDFLKGRITGKNYDRIMEDVSNTLNNVFGFSLSFFENKNFIIVNNIEEIDIPEVVHSFSESSKYRILLKPIIGALIMLRTPISEGQMWNILGRISDDFSLDMEVVKKVVKVDFVQDQYLKFKETDDSTAIYDPERTSYWFSLGPRALVECDQMMFLQRVCELYNKPSSAFKRVFATVNK